jgi:hypothetical protein
MMPPVIEIHQEQLVIGAAREYQVIVRERRQPSTGVSPDQYIELPGVDLVDG